MFVLEDPQNGAQFKTTYLTSLLRRAVNSEKGDLRKIIEKWVFSDVVVQALRKWKRSNIDEQSNYDMLKVLLGTKQLGMGAAMVELSSLTVSKHSLEVGDFEDEVQESAGLEKTKCAFVATLRDLVSHPNTKSVGILGKKGEEILKNDLKETYQYAACLVLDVLLDLQSDSSYWATPLGGNIVDGWSTKVSDDGEDDEEDEGKRN